MNKTLGVRIEQMKNEGNGREVVVDLQKSYVIK